MQARHNSSPENGPQHTEISNQPSVNTDFSRRTAYIPRPEFNDLPVYTGADLVSFLRWWARHYAWNKPDFRTHRLKLEMALEESVTGAFYQFIADGQSALASLMKDEFGDLMERVKPLDLMYAERIDTLGDLRKLEQMKLQVGEVLYGLATMLENGYQTQAENQQPEPSGSKTEWMTFGKTAKLLGISISTVSKWANKGRFTDNGIMGQKRRLSTASVLLVKQDIEDEYRKKGDDEYHDEFRRIR